VSCPRARQVDRHHHRQPRPPHLREQWAPDPARVNPVVTVNPHGGVHEGGGTAKGEGSRIGFSQLRVLFRSKSRKPEGGKYSNLRSSPAQDRATAVTATLHRAGSARAACNPRRCAAGEDGPPPQHPSRPAAAPPPPLRRDRALPPRSPNAREERSSSPKQGLTLVHFQLNLSRA